MPQRENVTPIRVLRNIASELAGPARSLGAVLVGYQGIRLFTPRPLSTLLESVANPAGLLVSLIALANTRDQLKSSLRAVFCVINASSVTAADIKRIQGYQVGLSYVPLESRATRFESSYKFRIHCRHKDFEKNNIS